MINDRGAVSTYHHSLCSQSVERCMAKWDESSKLTPAFLTARTLQCLPSRGGRGGERQPREDSIRSGPRSSGVVHSIGTSECGGQHSLTLSTRCGSSQSVQYTRGAVRRNPISLEICMSGGKMAAGILWNFLVTFLKQRNFNRQMAEVGWLLSGWIFIYLRIKSLCDNFDVHVLAFMMCEYGNRDNGGCGQSRRRVLSNESSGSRSSFLPLTTLHVRCHSSPVFLFPDMAVCQRSRLCQIKNLCWQDPADKSTLPTDKQPLLLPPRLLTSDFHILPDIWG